MKERKDVFVNTRFTANEIVSIQAQMDLEGYKSRSRFVRERVLSSQPRRRNLDKAPKDQASIAKKLEVLSADVRKIGNNYNQVVRAVNTAVGLRTKDGRPVVSNTSMEYQLVQLRRMMQDILSCLSQLESSLDTR